MSLYGYKKRWLPRSYLGPDAEKKNSLAVPKFHKKRVVTAGKKTQRPKPDVSRTNWTTAFPKQVEPDINAHTKEDKRLYRIEAKEYVSQMRRLGHTCPVFEKFDELPAAMQAMLTYPWNGKRRSNKLNEVHHRRGRLGKLLRNRLWWLAVSIWGHRAIHAFPNTARKFGWLCAKGEWNVQT